MDTRPPDRRYLQTVPERTRADRTLLMHYRRSGEDATRDELVERFLPLARQLARRYARPGEPIDDLFQVASMGLLKAIDRFNPELGYAFSTFAVPTIVGELKRYFRDTGWAVHVPRPIQERIGQVNRAVNELSRDLGRSPSPSELAERVGASTEEVLEALEASKAFDAVSLDMPRGGGDEGSAYAETVGEHDERFEMVEYNAVIGPTMAALPDRDRLILRLRFERDLTQSEIADRLGISQMHVSRIIRRSLDRLRTVAEAA
jgi:RNA polymerase sigma-B factor